MELSILTAVAGGIVISLIELNMRRSSWAAVCIGWATVALVCDGQISWSQPGGKSKGAPAATSPAPTTPATTAVSVADHLASLDLLAGEWTGELNGIAMHVSAKWDANKKFLRREFSLSHGDATLGGLQEVGWDPLSKHIRSWMFNDDGSYTDGIWTLAGNSWMVLATRVMPDGKIAKATQVYKFPDRNTLDWRLIGGTIDGQPAGEMEIVLKRTGETKK